MMSIERTPQSSLDVFKPEIPQRVRRYERGTEQEGAIRRASLDLAYSLLAQTNRELSATQISNKFTHALDEWAAKKDMPPDQDILTADFDPKGFYSTYGPNEFGTPGFIVRTFGEYAGLKYFAEAAQIARTYYDLAQYGEIHKIPEEVVIISDKRHPNAKRTAGKKSLMFVDTTIPIEKEDARKRFFVSRSNRFDPGKERLNLNFTDQPIQTQIVVSEQGRNGQPEAKGIQGENRPDVWLERFDSRRVGGWSSNVHENDLAITGADNIVIAGEVGTENYVRKLKLSADTGIHIVTQDSKVGNKLCAVEIEVRHGGIVQEGGNVFFQNITIADDYLQLDGTLTPNTIQGRDAHLESRSGFYLTGPKVRNSLENDHNVEILHGDPNRASRLSVQTQQVEEGYFPLLPASVEKNALPEPKPVIEEKVDVSVLPENQKSEKRKQAEAAFSKNLLPKDLDGEALETAFNEKYGANILGYDVEMPSQERKFFRTWIFDAATSVDVSVYKAFQLNAIRLGWKAYLPDTISQEDKTVEISLYREK